MIGFLWSTLSLISCSGTRITTLDHRISDTAAPVPHNTMILPVLQGGEIIRTEVPFTDIPASLASFSDIQYRAESFPGRGNIKDLVERILRTQGVPVEIAALVWVESDFNVGCYSRVGAAGPWQLMPETAREMGLRIDDSVDERYSWVASTRAAAKYLLHLYGMFDDWSLALAAYNCGPGRVLSGLQQGGTTFGEIELPGETDAFVPRFASAAEAYIDVELESGVLAVVWVPSGFDLRLLGPETGVEIDSLMDLNRSYLLERTPDDGQAWEIIVPAESVNDVFNAAWTIDPERYLVKEGDTWNGIAWSTGVSPEVLRGLNSAGSLRPGVLIGLPESQRRPVNAGYMDNPQFIRYTVRMGDTMSEIAAGVGVSSREVAAWNNMSSDNIIYPGDVLLLRRCDSTEAQDSPLLDNALPEEKEIDIVSNGVRIEHVIVEGDTLWDIAIRYSVSIEQIMYLNSLESSILSLGDVLLIIPE